MSDAEIPKSGNHDLSDDDIVVFSLDDEEINNLGKVIGTKYSREFLKITQKKELNLKEIAKIIENNENPRLPNPTHHKNRLEKLGLIKVTIKLQRKKGHKLKFYEGKKIIIIVPKELADLIQSKDDLKNMFKRIFKI
jgi:hypothetical protein